MAKSKISQEIKREVLGKVSSGRKVSDVAKEYGIPTTTVYTWLGREAGGKRSEILEVSKLRRENEALYKLLGRLVYQSEAAKKNS